MNKATMCLCAATLGCSVGGTRDDGGGVSFGPGMDESGGQSEGADSSEPEPGDDEESSTAPSESSSEEGGAPVGRCDKVDLLFVIEAPSHPPFPEAAPADCYWWDDKLWNQWWEYAQEYSNRYSMLQQGFATLVSELYVTVQVPDFNVLVTGSQVARPHYWGYAPDGTGACVPGVVQIDECDEVLGAGRNGFQADDTLLQEGYYLEECMPERFVGSGAMDLPETFACLAYHDLYWDEQLWGGYSGEGPDTLMDAMTAAVSPASPATTCNTGFLRDDALLVVVLLEVGADPTSDTSSGTPDAWKQALVDTKGGDADRVVVLSLAPDGADPHPLCAPEDTSPFALDLRAFTDSFEYALSGSTCLLDYPTFFRAGAEVIDAACGHEPPPAPE